MVREPIREDWKEQWGDPMGDKDVECIRILSNNINSLGVQKGNHKEVALKELLIQNQVDVICLQEVNLNWKRCRFYDSFYERFQCGALNNMKHSKAYNKQEDIKKFQRGGVAIASFNTFSQFVSDTGADETGLGRWSWILVRGKRNVKTRIISAYQPCNHGLSGENGFQTVYKQQQRYWQAKGDDSCPIVRFREDLSNKISRWLSNGDKIVLSIDVNEDVRNDSFNSAMTQLGLVSALRRKHGNNMPPTYQLGSYPIDDIYVSPTLMVMQSGCLECGVAPGDHRGLFVDIVERSMIGGDTAKIKPVKARRLVASNNLVRKKFLKIFKRQLQRNHVYERMNELEAMTKTFITARQEYTYEKMDRIKKSAFECAEKRCRKLSKGAVAFVPDQIQKFGIRITLINLLAKRKKGCLVSTKLIRRMAKKCQVINPFELNLEQLKSLRSESWKMYRSVKPNSFDLRFNWIDQRISQAKELGEKDKEKLLTMHKQREMLSDSHRRINFARGIRFQGGCKKLTVQDADSDSVRIVEDKEEMEVILMATYKEKFQQANGTPFTIPPLSVEIPIDGNSSVVDQILCGEYEVPSGVHEGAADFIHACQVPPQVHTVDPVDADISLDEYKSFWRAAKEKTQSSMSGIHFGVFKASVYCEYCSSVLSNFVRIPFRTGFGPSRYKNSLNVTLQKTAGDFRPEKQRTIHLIEAGFSQAAKVIFSKRMMKRARDNGLIPEQQFARKGSKSVDAAVLKVLVFDKCRLMRRRGMSYAGDLMNCYDRMTHASASLALRYLGAPQTAITSMIDILHNMNHFIRTAYGDSESFYTGSKEVPLQGGGQGNPAAPPMWIALTVIILKVLHTFEPGIEILSAISLSIISFTAIVYVDDTDLFFYGKLNESKQDMVVRAQCTVEKWTNALWATGGVLRPEKGWWCSVDFQWLGSKWKYEDDVDEALNIQIRNSDGEMVNTPQIKCSTGKKTLGVYIAADGNFKDQHEYLVQKSNIWAEAISKSSLSRFDSLLCLTSTISKTWNYPLPATRFTKKECQQIMVPVYKQVLPKMGFNQKLPKAYRFGLKRLQGLQLPDLYLQQGLSQIKTFLSHVHKGTVVGNMLEDQLEVLTLHCGSSISIFDLQYKDWEYLMDECFCKSLWQFCYQNQISLRGQYNIPPVQRQNDVFIMDVVIQFNCQHAIYSATEIHIFNRCRLFLQVLLLSDISNGDGRYIAPHIINGFRHKDRVSSFQWPNQNNPTNKEWDLWRKMLKQIFCSNMSSRLLLHTKLGRWIREGHQQWVWFANMEGTCLYQQLRNGRAMRYLACNTHWTRDNRVFVPDLELTGIPEGTARATIEYMTHTAKVRFTGSAFMLHNDRDENEVSWQRSSCIYDKAPEVISDVNLRGEDGVDLATAIADGDCNIVCDGSYHPDFQISTMAVVIESKTRIPLGRGYCRVPGPASAQNSYRAELFGIYVTLCTVEAVISKHKIQTGQIDLYCDNLWALNKAKYAKDKIHGIQIHHYDILWAITKLFQRIPISISLFHVYGHQSAEVAARNPIVRMNIDADQLAKQYLSYCITNEELTKFDHLGTKDWRILIKGEMVVDHFDSTVLDRLIEEKFFRYLVERGEVERLHLLQIDWQALGGACSLLGHTERFFVTRFVSGFLPTQEYLWNLKKEDSKLCPRCSQIPEDRLHFIYCSHDDGIINLEEELLRFLLWAEKNLLHPDIKYCFLEIFLQGRHATFLQCIPSRCSESIRQAAMVQDSFGRIQFHKGRLSTQWAVAQSEYMRQKYPSKKFNQKKWSSKLVYIIFQIHHSLWRKRCRCVHHKSEGVRNIAVRDRLQETVRHTYEVDRGEVQATDRKLFEDWTCDEILQWHEDEQRAWLRSVKAAKKKCSRAISNTLGTMRDNFARWMRRNEAIT